MDIKTLTGIAPVFFSHSLILKPHVSSNCHTIKNKGKSMFLMNRDASLRRKDKTINKFKNSYSPSKKRLPTLEVRKLTDGTISFRGSL